MKNWFAIYLLYIERPVFYAEVEKMIDDIEEYLEESDDE